MELQFLLWRSFSTCVMCHHTVVMIIDSVAIILTLLLSQQQMALSDIELHFPLFNGASPSQSIKRRKMLETSITEYLKCKYIELLIAADSGMSVYIFVYICK
jgi:hypothetical protein